MRKLFIALLSACLSLSAMAAPAGYTTIMATNVVDASGNPLASGTATFQVVDGSGHPMSVQVGGYGQVHTEAVSVPVLNGAFQAQVVDVSATSPTMPCVLMTIVDNATGATVLTYNCVQPQGATYDLDMFSANTTPVVPQAGQTFTGNLGILGNLNVTGNLNLGGFNVGNLSTAIFTSQNANGVLNAALYTGVDIAAKVGAAFAALPNGGTVHIPAGAYSFASTMLLPDSVGGTTGYHIDCDPGAVLTYVGTGTAIQLTNDIPGAAEVGIDGHGGCQLQSATTGVGTGINIPPSNTTYVTGMKIKKFANGIYIPGGNSVQIFNDTIQSNTCGICTTTVNPTGTNGFAPNALHIHDNEISSNGWGYHSADGHVSASHALGNVIRDNVFEANTIGDINADWDAHLMVTGNYFESAGVAVAAGASNNVYDIHVEGNYFTASAAERSEVEIGYGFDFFVSNNYEEGSASESSGCMVNSVPGASGGNRNIVAVNAFAQDSEGHAPGVTATPNELCVQGAPVTTFGGTQRVESNLHVNGTLTVDAPGFHLGPNTQNSGLGPVGFIGGVPVFVANFDPGGACSTAGVGVNSGMWLTGDGLYICQGSGPTSTSGVWIKK
jgi:hypothetical protein